MEKNLRSAGEQKGEGKKKTETKKQRNKKRQVDLPVLCKVDKPT